VCVYPVNVIWLQTGKKHDKSLVLGPSAKRLFDVPEVWADLSSIEWLRKAGVAMIQAYTSVCWTISLVKSMC
jgi:hypothetical protein